MNPKLVCVLTLCLYFCSPQTSAAKNPNAVSDDVVAMIRQDDVEALRAWVSENSKSAEKCLNTSWGLLRHCAEQNAPDCMAYVISLGVDVNTRWNDCTALDFVEDPQTARVLLQAGADVDGGDAWRPRILIAAQDFAIARQNGEDEIAKQKRALVTVLREFGAKYDMEVAAYLGDLETVQQFDRDLPADVSDEAFKTVIGNITRTNGASSHARSPSATQSSLAITTSPPTF